MKFQISNFNVYMTSISFAWSLKVWYFCKSCGFKWSIKSAVQTISDTKTLECSIKSVETIFYIRPFTEKMDNYIIYIFVPNFLKILNLSNRSNKISNYWWSYKRNISDTLSYTLKLEITFAYFRADYHFFEKGRNKWSVATLNVKITLNVKKITFMVNDLPLMQKLLILRVNT